MIEWLELYQILGTNNKFSNMKCIFLTIINATNFYFWHRNFCVPYSNRHKFRTFVKQPIATTRWCHGLLLLSLICMAFVFLGNEAAFCGQFGKIPVENKIEFVLCYIPVLILESWLWTGWVVLIADCGAICIWDPADIWNKNRTTENGDFPRSTVARPVDFFRMHNRLGYLHCGKEKYSLLPCKIKPTHFMYIVGSGVVLASLFTFLKLYAVIRKQRWPYRPVFERVYFSTTIIEGILLIVTLILFLVVWSSLLQSCKTSTSDYYRENANTWIFCGVIKRLLPTLTCLYSWC